MVGISSSLPRGVSDLPGLKLVNEALCLCSMQGFMSDPINLTLCMPMLNFDSSLHDDPSMTPAV
jgi:hypothetical protein